MIGHYPHTFFDEIIHPTTSGAVHAYDDEVYRLWTETMFRYAEESNSSGLAALNFWLVIRLNKKDFGDHIEMHETLPMMIPKEGSGKLVGLARDRDELEALTDQDTEEFVYLTYKIKIQGQQAWRDLLEFMGKHNMLDRDQ